MRAERAVRSERRRAPRLDRNGRLHRLLGVDLVAVDEVARSLERFGERYLSRVYTPAEVAYCTSGGRPPAAHLAARFAAKEATFKALRGGDTALDWRSIEIVRHADGSCTVKLHGEAQKMAEGRGVRTLDVSLSHDGEYAVAVVVGDAYLPQATPRRRAGGVQGT